MKKIAVCVLVLAMVLSMAACGKENTTKKSEGVMTYAEYTAAALDSEVLVEGYIQGYAYNSAYGNVCMFLQDGDGAYYAYRAVCSEEQAKKLGEGVKVKVSGVKSEWAGEVEIGEGCTFEVEEGKYVAEAQDVTEKLGSDEISGFQNQKVTVKGAVVAASKNADGQQAAFLYNWDGSGMEGSNNDLYFNVTVNGETYSFTVESDEQPEGSDVYKAVTGLQIGDTVDLTGFLYWYEGAQLHVSGVKVR